jgi:hypothetical protein
MIYGTGFYGMYSRVKGSGKRVKGFRLKVKGLGCTAL